MYNYDRRNKQAFTNPYREKLEDVRTLWRFMREDTKGAEAEEELRIKMSEQAIEIVGEFFDVLRRHPLADPKAQNTMERLLARELRDFAGRANSSMSWPDTSRVSKALKDIKKVLDRTHRTNLPLVKAWMAATKELPTLDKLWQKGMELRKGPAGYAHYDEIERLLKELPFRNAETDEEADVNSDLWEIKALYAKDDPPLRKIEVLIDGIISALEIGNPNQLRMFSAGQLLNKTYDLSDEISSIKRGLQDKGPLDPKAVKAFREASKAVRALESFVKKGEKAKKASDLANEFRGR